MNKKEFIKATAVKSGYAQKNVAEVYDAALEVIFDTLKTGEEVALTGIGKFIVVDTAARDMRNPANGEMVHVSAKKNPKFRVSSTLKNALN